jgi:hypothetical protein
MVARARALLHLALLARAATQPLYVLNGSAFAALLDEDLPFALDALPFFESADARLTEAFYFRARLLKYHVRATNVSAAPYVITEFAPDVPWAGRANAIPCAAGHHLAEARWLRGANGTAIADSAAAWWMSNLPGVKLNYFTWHAHAILRRLEVTGLAAGLPAVAALLPNATDIGARFLAGELPPGAAFDADNGCVWNSPGNEGEENAISGPGCRPLVQALLFGEARALSALCGFAGNASCAAAFAARADAFQAALLRLWSAELGTFATLQGGAPAPPAPPAPPGFTPARRDIFCCDQAPCAGGHSRFLYEGADAAPACFARCAAFPQGRCHFATLASEPWCQLAEFCNATNPWAGGSSETYAYAPPGAAARALADVRELASLSSPWYFNAIPAVNASVFGVAWEAAFDPDGFAGPFGVRTAEKRHPGYTCRPGSCCEWSGPVWPFETAKLLTAAVEVLQSPALAAAVPALTRARFNALLADYASQHLNTTWWISDGANTRANVSEVEAAGLFFKGLGRAWLAEAGCAEDAQWTDAWREGYRYLHSSFIDIVATGVAGLRPAAASARALTVAPLQAGDAAVPWWCFDGAVVGGHIVTVFWDAAGARYGRGKGLSVLLDGVLAAHADSVEAVLTVPL